MRKTGLLYLLMLLIPAVLLGIGGILLLTNEQQNIGTRQRLARTDQARLVAGHFDLLVKETLAAKLIELDALLAPHSSQESVITALQAWEQNDPLVRNTFLWHGQRHLLYPNLHQPATNEQADFIQRFAPLFTAMEPWPTQEVSDTSSKNISIAGGWLPWYSQNRLHLLGWRSYRQQGRGVVGLELEMATLLARFVELGNDLNYPGALFLLFDGNGKPFYQSGNLGAGPPLTITSLPASAATVPLSNYMPHWEVAVIPLQTNVVGQAYLLFAYLLLAILMLGLLVGGYLLWRHGQQMRLESMRKSDFVSNVSHELKTPLTSIRMYAEILEEGRAKPEKQERYLKIIVTEAQRLTRLVNNVLDFSRIEQGRKQYNTRPLDLDALIQEELDAQSLMIQQRGVEVDLNLNLNANLILADRDAMEQVVINLTDNAIKYAGEAGSLTIRSSVVNQMAEFTIEDRGPGVPKSHQERIFEAFHRVDDSLSSSTSGTGLGLSICRRLVMDQGGTLHYRDRDGGGASFCVRLPIAPSKEIIP